MRNSLKHWCQVILATSMFGIMPAWAQPLNLPIRNNTPETTNSTPHKQIGVKPVPEISGQLLHRVSKIPGVEFRATVVIGATGFWLNERIKLVRPGVTVDGREFAHKHADGSLHAILPPEVAEMAVQTGWAVHHPWANQRPGWDGFVLIYTPTSRDELEVVFRLVMAAYGYLTGKGS